MTAPALDIRRAWEIHDPSRKAPPIGPEQRGLLRLFRQSLVAPAAKIQAAVHSPERRRAAADFTYKKGKGRERAFNRLNRMLAPAVLQARTDAPAAIWAWLRAGGPVIANSEDPGHDQDCVVVCVTVAGQSGDGRSASAGAWSFEAPDHALARLLPRTARKSGSK